MKRLVVFLIMIVSLNSFAKNTSNEATGDKNIAGFKLMKIHHGGIYEKLGLKEGDVIKKINGETVTTPEIAKSLFSKIKDADKIEIVIFRNGKEEVLRYSIK
ncbi:MAG: hypothetical protein ACXVCY_17745 [Pseudobdellovibrionaceae bacterium]